VKRIAGFRDRIGEYNLANPLDQFNIVTQLPCGGQRDIAFKATSDVIQAHPDLVGIFAINDPGALGAVGALEKVNRLDDITIIGFDGQPEGKVAIRDGKIYADPIQFPKRIGRQTVQTIMKYLNGHEVEKTQLIETALYRQEDGLNDPDMKDYR
jgi:ribose transport system substrate-binding protein